MTTLRTLRSKTLRDLWGSRSRTALVALSVAIGVLGVGMIVATWDFLMGDLARRYAAINPAHIEISVPAGVAVDDLAGLATVPGVAEVQGRAVFRGRFRLPGETAWRSIEIIALPDWDAQAINRLSPESGVWPPGRRQALAERASLEEIGAAVGEGIIIDTLGREIALTLAGTAHQQDDVMAMVKGAPVILVSLDTLASIQGHDRLNTIYLTVDPELARSETGQSILARSETGQSISARSETGLSVSVRSETGQSEEMRKSAVAAAAQTRLEKAGYSVGRVTLRDPAVHPAQDVLDVLLLVMGMLGVLSLALSSFLVANTMSALITQQIRQIGVMKAIGADAWIVARAYGLTVLIYGLLGIALAMPLAQRTGYRLAEFLASQINVDLFPYRASPAAFAVMAVVGLAVPLIAAARPVWQGASITVRQAIADYGLGGGSGDNALSRALAAVQGLPRTAALALRNAVRVPSRLLLTVITLGLGGAIFIAVLSTDSSFSVTIDTLIEGQYGMDALIAFNDEERVSWAAPLAESHSEVTHAEAWYFNQATMRLASGQDVQVLVQAGPDDTQFYQPNVVAGRWLLPEDGNAIVVNRKWAEEEGVQVGDSVTLDLGAEHEESAWVVVGINQDLVQQRTGVFVPFDSLDRILQRTDRTATLEVRYTVHDAASQQRITGEIVQLLDGRGADVHSTQVLGQIKTQVTSQYRILVVFLLVMAGLTALVGGIGLMGMMSINVLERSKEIGVMRAIGADTPAIVQIFWGESMVVSLVSFILAAILSWPLSEIMTWAVGMAFIHMPLNFSYAVHGLGLWLLIVLAIGTLASIAPALSAARLSVRESLSYE